VFFAVSYGQMLSSIGSFKPFPWGLCIEKNRQTKWVLAKRLIATTLLFNIAPLALFALGYIAWEDRYSYPTEYTYINVVLVAISALSVFAPYRFYHFIFVLGYKKEKKLKCNDYAKHSKHWLKLYTCQDYLKIRNKRGLRLAPGGQMVSTIFFLSLILIPVNIGVFLVVFGGWLLFVMSADLFPIWWGSRK
jgi:hypothetical protein